MEYYDELFLSGAQADAADKVAAAWRDRFVAYSRHGDAVLPREVRARQGFHRAAPGCSRAPLALSITTGIAMGLIHDGFREMALAVLLSFSAYLRPGECRDLRCEDVLGPVGPASSALGHTSIVIAPESRGAASKTQTFDDTIILDSSDLPGLGALVLALARSRRPSAHLFEFNHAAFRERFESLAKGLIPTADLVLYQLRHGGASHDLLFKRRELQSIKMRGRWRADQSLRRYAKQGRVQSLVAQLSPASRRFCDWSGAHVMGVLSGRLAPRRLPAVKRAE